MLVAKERDGKITETFGWDGIGLLAKDGVVYANEAHVSGGVPLAAVHAGSENAEMQYFDSDYLGTTTAVYSADGQVDAKLVGSYGAGSEFGELRFTGKPYDADLDAHVFPYRNYKSEAGSWASADPAGFPDGPNQHYYAAVPTMGLDPLGLLDMRISTEPEYHLLGSPWEIGREPHETYGSWQVYDDPLYEERLMVVEYNQDQEARYYREYRGFEWRVISVATGVAISVGIAANFPTASALAASAAAGVGTEIVTSQFISDLGWYRDSSISNDYLAQTSISHPDQVSLAYWNETEWESREL
jgi:RHS repeat-associated protein